MKCNSQQFRDEEGQERYLLGHPTSLFSYKSKLPYKKQLNFNSTLLLLLFIAFQIISLIIYTIIAI